MTTSDEFIVITMGGTGEPAAGSGGMPKGMLGGLCGYLNSKFHCEQLDWNNSYGPVGGQANDNSYKYNVAEAVELLTARALAHKGWPLVLMGYSASAHVVSLAAAAIEEECDLRAVVVLANPLRARGDSSAPWWGIAGERQKLDNEQLYSGVESEGHYAGKTLWFDVANDKDVIPCCPQQQPMRDFYGLTKEFCLVDPAKWGMDVMDYVTHAMIFGSNRDYSPLDYWLAMAYCRGYLFDGQHTTYYSQRLAVVANHLMYALDAV